MTSFETHLKNSKSTIRWFIVDFIDLVYALVEYNDAKPRGLVSEDIQHRIDKIDHIIEQYVVKLPSLASVETNIKVRKKQFYYIILYYMINKQWPHIKKQAPCLIRLRAFFYIYTISYRQ